MFWIMLLLVVAMAVYLIRLRERASDHFAEAAQFSPLSASDAANSATGEPLRLYLANDADGALAEKPVRFPLPSDANARARVVLEKLLAEYAAAGSLHPLQSGAGVEEVFLLPVPGAKTGVLAVVNLTNTFAQNHPSGIEPETLTLLSMIATLRANLPQVTQVRFLVDGQQRATLAGHADLTRTYLAAGTQMAPGREFPAGAQP
jgi:spore germination protein GerM